jgi:hypothetical protein
MERQRLILLNDDFSLGIHGKVIGLKHLASIEGLKILDIDLASLKIALKFCL